MAAAIPEVVETAESAGAAATGARGASRARQAPRERPVRQAAGPRRTGSQRPSERARSGARRAGRGALRARLPGSHSYQPVILAEFVVAIVVVATGPILKGGTPEAQTKGSPSPYSVNTLKQLVAIGGVYFVLALLAASQRAGRYAAWFGGLILIALGLAELKSGDLSAIFNTFGPNATSNPDASAGQLAQLPPGFLPTASGGPPTPTGQVPENQAITQQSIAFTQPGVATTTETTPGVTLAGN